MINVSGLGRIIDVGILLGLILLAGCSRLPAYSQPRVEAGDASTASQGISYRDLTVADFHAVVLPEDLRSHDHHLNAHTSVALRTQPGARYVFAFSAGDGRQLSCGRAENLAFQALMLPQRSWWSRTLAKDKETICAAARAGTFCSDGSRRPAAQPQSSSRTRPADGLRC